jgi:hypothetical protein
VHALKKSFYFQCGEYRENGIKITVHVSLEAKNMFGIHEDFQILLTPLTEYMKDKKKSEVSVK